MSAPALLVFLPNLITLARLLCVPVVVWLIISGHWETAFWVFFAASVTDGLDGSLARGLNARTELGAYLDAIADKALLVSVYITLGHAGQIPLWLVILVVSRDVLVAQIVLAGVVLADLGLHIIGDGVVAALVWVVMLTTVASGAGYLIGWGRGLVRG